MALWQRTSEEIRLVRYWELERLTGFKHHELALDGDFSPDDLVDHLLGLEGVKRADVDTVWGTPGLTGETPLPDVERHGLPLHSLCHLFSGLGMDSDAFQRSTIVALAIDGGPDYTLENEIVGDQWYAGAVSHHGHVELYPVESPGLLWQAAQRHFGLEPGTLMALAHATPVELDVAPAVLEQQRYWGGYPLLERCYELVGDLIARAERQIGTNTTAIKGFTREELVGSAVMKVVQTASVAIVRRSIDFLLKHTDSDPWDVHLSISGGYALNCPTNSAMMDAYGFRSLLTPPCANDSGQALGIGLLGFFGRGELRTCRLVTGLPYAGEKNLRLAAAMPRWQHRIVDESEFDESVFVADLRTQPVAWADGAAEVGPRALGHRSLLGDPTQQRTKDILNAVKQRQWWRPVAPIVLEEHVREWFAGARRSPYMLETFQLLPGQRDRVPAIAHLDGSARIQTLSEGDDAFLHAAVSAFHRATGVPIICNTSLNDRGEPIANCAADVINFCVRKGIRVAYIGRRRLLLDTSSEVTEADGPEPRPLHERYAAQSPRPDAVYGDDADAQMLLLLYLWPGLYRFTTMPGSERRLRTILRKVVRGNPEFPAHADRFLQGWRRILDGSAGPGGTDVR